MFSVSDLSEEQIATIHSWVAEGAQMADVQRRLESEFGHKLTYMDTRFVALDLGLEFQVDETPEPKADDPVVAEETSPEPGLGAAGGVSVDVHQVARPGSVLSGSVVFSDGQTGNWMIDQAGRLAVDPDASGYQPTEADLAEFQQKLRAAVETQM